MARDKQFHCPGCGTTLHVPAVALGITAPCPRCGCLITAPAPPPEPTIARLPVQLPARRPRGWADAAQPNPPESAASPGGAAVKPARSARSGEPMPERWWFAVSACLTVLALAGGFMTGRLTDLLPMVAPAADPAAVGPAPPAEDTGPPLMKNSVAARPEFVLRQFLAAPDWPARASLSLFEDKVRPIMERYYQTRPDGPTEVTSISLDHAENDIRNHRMLFLFRVATKAIPAGFPVVVTETPDGWRVDWESFAEFRDDSFATFVANQGDSSGRFRVVVRGIDDKPLTLVTAGQEFTAYRLDPPLPGRGHKAWVEKDSDLHRRLAAAVAAGQPFTPVLDLTKLKLADGSCCLQITGIAADDWRPLEPR